MIIFYATYALAWILLFVAMIYACKEADEYEKKLKRIAKKTKNTNENKKEE